MRHFPRSASSRCGDTLMDIEGLALIAKAAVGSNLYSQAESVNSQASSLRTERSWTPAHIHGASHVGRALD
jgi:hypothetical protein